MKIIHFSDIHYGATGQNLEKLVDDVILHYKEHSVKPLIINSGDLVNDALESQMKSCRDHLIKLKDNGFEMLICPGNHDLKAKRGRVPVPNAQKMFNEYFSPLLPVGKNYYGEGANNLLKFPLIHRYDNYFFIGIDSNKTGNRKTARGVIGSVQIDELSEAIDKIQLENNEAIIIVYVHHHPFEFPFGYAGLGYKVMLLEDKDLLMEVLSGKANVLLFGHTHWNRRYSGHQEKYDINVVQLTAGTTWGKNIDWTEIDLSNYEVIGVSKPI